VARLGVARGLIVFMCTGIGQRDLRETMKELLSGNEAISRGAYEAGCVFAAAYPGTPSTEILETIAGYKEIYAEWAPNEKVALEVATGAAFCGARAIVAMKHVGLNVAADPLFTLSYTGVGGGIVIVTADDPGMHSSQNEQDNRYYAIAAKVPMFEPSDSQEAKDFTIKAFEISERYDTPVLLRTTTRVAHSECIVEIGERKDLNREYKFERDPEKFVMVPAHARLKHVAVEKRTKALLEYSENCAENVIEKRGGDIGVIASGISYQYVREVLPDASVLKLGFTNPLPVELVRKFAGMVKTLYVIEELEPIIETHVRSLGIKARGKPEEYRCGELSPSIVRSFMLGTKAPEMSKAAKSRPPTLCAGCPHRGVFYTLNRLKLITTGDIGCYTLGVAPPLNSIDTCVDMGASICHAAGASHVISKERQKGMVAVIGDSTFIHSGITSLIDAVYNKANMTLLLLDNRTTAMTGGQQHPGTGKTIRGEETHELDLAQMVKACGVKSVRVVDPYDLKETREAIEAAVSEEGVSVVMTQQPCRLIDRSTWKEPYAIDEEKCKVCGACLSLGCPAIVNRSTETAKKAPEINAMLCIGCGLCAQVCKFEAVRVPAEKTR
jgi:indolepyruvate ferredoxin oxidoreductase alpha subunit